MKKIDVYNFNNQPNRYIICTYTPDNGKSTFPECYGSTATHNARAVASFDQLYEARSYADKLSVDIVDWEKYDAGADWYDCTTPVPANIYDQKKNRWIK